jgi:hypothetical protein
MMRVCPRAGHRSHAANPKRIYLVLIDFETRRLRGGLTTTAPDNGTRNNRGVIDSTICDWHRHFDRLM